jgi:5,10-methylene-tetrahydrofolate dehydrogenase/methenyl tetrahydrofolate cyclohydrolase
LGSEARSKESRDKKVCSLLEKLLRMLIKYVMLVKRKDVSVVGQSETFGRLLKFLLFVERFCQVVEKF